MQLGARPTARRRGLAGNIENGLAVPLLGGEALFDLVFGSYRKFAAFLAAELAYPLPSTSSLARVLRFYKLSRQEQGYTDSDLRADYLFYVKKYIVELLRSEGADADRIAEAEQKRDDDTLSVSQLAEECGYPRFAEPDDPLQVLANKPFRAYITTSPFTFVESALIRAGKRPYTAVCLWRPALENALKAEPVARFADSYMPSREQPLVYHLFGLDAYADTLVLTEDDHLDFLINVSQYRGDESRDRIHALARDALSRDLLLLGFTLDTLPFRTVFGGLVRPVDPDNPVKSGICCLQLEESDAQRVEFQELLQREAATYVKGGGHFEVFWGDLKGYAATLG